MVSNIATRQLATTELFHPLHISVGVLENSCVSSSFQSVSLVFTLDTTIDNALKGMYKHLPV